MWLKAARDEYDLPVYSRIMEQYSKFTEDIRNGRVVSAYALDRHGVVSAVSKMAFGNQMGVCLESSLDKDAIFAPAFGDIVAEVKADTFEELVGEYTLIGEVTNEKAFAYGDVKIGMDDALDAWTKPLEKVFATKSAESSDIPVEEKLYDASTVHVCSHKIGQPTVFIPVFPGTNCEYDSARRLREQAQM